MKVLIFFLVSTIIFTIIICGDSNSKVDSKVDSKVGSKVGSKVDHPLCKHVVCKYVYKPGQVRKTWLKILLLSCCPDIRQDFIRGSKNIDQI